MNKLLYSVFLFFSVIFTLVSCEQNKYPTVNFTSEPLIVGDSALLEVLHVSDARFSYSATRNESMPVFEISDFTGTTTMVYALHPGTDTLWVGTMWADGTSAHGLGFYSIINVIPK